MSHLERLNLQYTLYLIMELVMILMVGVIFYIREQKNILRILKVTVG